MTYADLQLRKMVRSESPLSLFKRARMENLLQFSDEQGMFLLVLWVKNKK